MTPPRAGSGGLHRTGALGRRGSIEAGTFKEAFFAAPAPGETDQLLTACRRARRTCTLSTTERRLAALTAARCACSKRSACSLD